jgi:acyl carrier protein
MSMASLPPIIEQVRQFITENYLYMRRDVQLHEDDALLARGIIDSMGVMEIVAFLEEEFGVTVADTDITEENLGSLGAIARYVTAKQSAGRALSRPA